MAVLLSFPAVWGDQMVDLKWIAKVIPMGITKDMKIIILRVLFISSRPCVDHVILKRRAERKSHKN